MREKMPDYKNPEMKKAILELIHDKNDRKILYLKHVDGRTLREIADETKMAYSTVRDHYYKQRKILIDAFRK